MVDFIASVAQNWRRRIGLIERRLIWLSTRRRRRSAPLLIRVRASLADCESSESCPQAIEWDEAPEPSLWWIHTTEVGKKLPPPSCHPLHSQALKAAKARESRPQRPAGEEVKWDTEQREIEVLPPVEPPIRLQKNRNSCVSADSLIK